MKKVILLTSILSLLTITVGLLIDSFQPSKNLTLQRSLASKTSKAEGGSSDGGGNAVMCTMFDLYENKGSIETSLEGLKQLEPRLESFLNDLDKKIPAISYLSSGGLGSIITRSIRGKRLYLESKPMTPSGCVNGSVFRDKKRNVVGCQNDKEIRFNKNFILHTSSKNNSESALALISHELILSWFRDIFSSQDKFSYEYELRRLNEFIILQKPNSYQLAEYLNTKLSLQALTESQYLLASEVKSKFTKSVLSFCKSPEDKIDSIFARAAEDPLLTSFLPNRLPTLIKLSTEGLESKENQLIFNSLCYKPLLYSTPPRKPKTKIFSKTCLSDLKARVDATKNLFERKDMNKDDKVAHMQFTDNFDNITISLCQGLKLLQLEKVLFMTEKRADKITKELRSEAINYLRYYREDIYKKHNYSPEEMEY